MVFIALLKKNPGEIMSRNSIAIVESPDLTSTLKAVEIMVSRARVTLMGRYFLGKEKVAAVMKGTSEEVDSAAIRVRTEMGNASPNIGIIHDFPRKALEIMLAPHNNFQPVCTVRDFKLTYMPSVNKGVKPLSGAADTGSAIGSTPPVISLKNFPGLLDKRKKRLEEVLQYFWVNRNRKITSNGIIQSLTHLSKPTLGRDLEFLARKGFIGKKARGRGTYYLYKPLEFLG